MELSICSWTFGNEPIEKVMKFVKSIGYDAVEIHAALAIENPQRITQLSEQYQLKVSGLTGDAAWPNENKDLANRNPNNRMAAIEYFKKQVDAVKQVNGKYLIVCPSAVGKSALQGNGQEDWEWALDSVRQLTDLASDLGVKLIIEPLNRYESCILNTAEDAYRFVEKINHPFVKTLLDTYHMNIEETDMVVPIQKVSEILDVVHVADSNRQSLGRGHIPFSPFLTELKRLNFQGTIVVECSIPGPNPFSATKESQDMRWIYQYAEESFQYLKNWIEKVN